MINTERLHLMEEYIEEHQIASMEELCNEFAISMNTLRVDIGKLVRKGVVVKVYGGVQSNSQTQIPTLEIRLRKNINIKRTLARYAAKYIQADDVVYMDAGSTTMHILEYVDPKIPFTVLTNSLLVVNKASAVPSINLIVVPGKYEHTNGAFLSADIGEFIKKYNIKTAFMSSTGISEDGNFTISSLMEYEVKRYVVSNSRNIILLSDSGKIGNPALLTFATLSQIDTFITDLKAPESFLAICREKGVETIVLTVDNKL